MKTAEEIISYLEMELAEAQTTYDLLKTEDKQQAMFHLIKMATITELLEEIKYKSVTRNLHGSHTPCKFFFCPFCALPLYPVGYLCTLYHLEFLYPVG